MKKQDNFQSKNCKRKKWKGRILHHLLVNNIYIDIINSYKYLLNISVGIIYSLNRCLLSNYYVLGIVPDARNIAVNSKDIHPYHCGMSSFWWGKHHEQICQIYLKDTNFW